MRALRQRRAMGSNIVPSGRPAVTLTEVLVAIFVMGIGLLALLVLFPLGALSMAQALKDDRASQAAAQAAAIETALDFRNDPALSVLAPAPQSDVFVHPYPGNFLPAIDAYDL